MQRILTLGSIALSIITTALVASAAEKDYMVIDISGGIAAKNYPITYLDAVPEGGWGDEYKTKKFVLRLIEPGKFMMGSPSEEVGRGENETQHEVTLTKGFYIGVFLVTQYQWKLLMDTAPSKFVGDTLPVEKVSYNDIRGKAIGNKWPTNNEVNEESFMGVLRAKTEQAFDLPTEAQWEYACRAGTTTAFNNGKDMPGDNLIEHAWFSQSQLGDKKAEKITYSVGTKLPNAWGLYDMHGSVYEWCLDWHQDAIGAEALTDPKGPEKTPKRALRGGAWYAGASSCRSAKRGGEAPHTTGSGGFRILIP